MFTEYEEEGARQQNKEDAPLSHKTDREQCKGLPLSDLMNPRTEAMSTWQNELRQLEKSTLPVLSRRRGVKEERRRRTFGCNIF